MKRECYFSVRIGRVLVSYLFGRYFKWGGWVLRKVLFMETAYPLENKLYLIQVLFFLYLEDTFW